MPLKIRIINILMRIQVKPIMRKMLATSQRMTILGMMMMMLILKTTLMTLTERIIMIPVLHKDLSPMMS